MSLRLVATCLIVCWGSLSEAQQASATVYQQYADEYRKVMSNLSRATPIWCHGFMSLPWGIQFFVADGGVVRRSTPRSFYSSYYRDFISDIDTLTHLHGLHQAAGYQRINVDAEFSSGAEYWSSNCEGSDQIYQEICLPMGELCANLISETNDLILTIYLQR